MTSESHPLVERLRQIRERVDKTTPGPWAWESIAEKSNEFAVGQAFDRHGAPFSGRIPGGEWIEETVIERRGVVGMNESGHARFADADFIAHAREDVPFLLAELQKAADQIVADAERIAQLEAAIINAFDRVDRCALYGPSDAARESLRRARELVREVSK